MAIYRNPLTHNIDYRGNNCKYDNIGIVLVCRDLFNSVAFMYESETAAEGLRKGYAPTFYLTWLSLVLVRGCSCWTRKTTPGQILHPLVDYLPRGRVTAFMW